MATKNVLYINFRNGIKHVPGFSGNRERDLKDILNMDISDEGFLTPRPGMRPIETTRLQTGQTSIPDQDVTIGTRPDEFDYYEEGDKLFIAHWLGDDQDDALTRFYYLNEKETGVQIRNGRLLLIASENGQYFIDLKDNRRYTWNLQGAYIMDREPADIPQAYGDALSNLSLIASGAREFIGPALTAVSNDNFPYGYEVELRPIVWRVVYYNPQLEIRSESPQAHITLGTINPIEQWLFAKNIQDNSGTRHDYRYQARFADEVINEEDRRLSGTAFNANEHLIINTAGRPDWATHIEVYRGFLPESFLEETLIEEDTSLSAGDYTSAIQTGVGLGLSVAALIAGNIFFAPFGAALAVTGFYSYATRQGVDKVRFDVSRDALAAADTVEYERMAIEQLPPIVEAGATTDIVKVPVPIRYVRQFDHPTDPVYLDYVYTQSPPGKLAKITEHAGRIYGVDKKDETVVFSHIDGNGVSDYFSFPLQNKLPTTSSGIAPIEALEQTPNKGGLYVFKRDAIHFIDGQNIFSGLYDINVSAQTDIDAAQYKKNIGCISPYSIVNDGSVVLFVGSDEQIYTLIDKQATPIGLSVKPFIQAMTFEEQQKMSAGWYKEKFYIALLDSTLLLDTERKYWTRYDWNLKDIIWDRGGLNPKSRFYGITKDDQLMELAVSDTDQKFPIMVEANTQLMPHLSTACGVYVYTDDKVPVKVTVGGNEPVREVSKEFTPRLGNKYFQGVHVKGRHLTMKIEADEPISIDRIILQETA